jgi:hypothetical protein
LVYSNLELYGDPEVIKVRRPTIESLFAAAPSGPFAAFGRLCTANFIPSFSLAIARREALNGLKFLSDKKYAVWLDWFLWLQASLTSKFLYLPQRLVKLGLYKDSYCNKFLLKTGIMRLILFELKYRRILLREIILKSRGICKKIHLLGLFFFGFLKSVRRIWRRAKKRHNRRNSADVIFILPN